MLLSIVTDATDINRTLNFCGAYGMIYISHSVTINLAEKFHSDLQQMQYILAQYKQVSIGNAVTNPWGLAMEQRVCAY